MLAAAPNENRSFFVPKAEEDVAAVDGAGDTAAFPNNLEPALRDASAFRVAGSADGDDPVLPGLKRFVSVVETEVVKFENPAVELAV